MEPKDLPADEYTGNYGRGGYYGYTYDQESYNRQVRRALKVKRGAGVSLPKDIQGNDLQDVAPPNDKAGGETA